MPFSDRHAPEDTAIRREELAGNIDVRGPGRYYPEEYGAQIQAAHQKGQLIADIPATMAGIVINRNDHALSTWYNKERAELNDEKEFYQQLEANKRQLLALDADLKVHDTMVKLDSDLINAREHALNNDGKVYDEYAKILDNYKGMFDDTPALASRFNSLFQRKAQDSLREGLKEDIQNGYIKMGGIMEISRNTINDSILSGNISALDGIQQFMKDNAKWISRLHATEIPKMFNTIFNQFVQTEATAIINTVKEGNLSADEAMKQLQGLRNLYSAPHNFDLIGEDNQILKDTEGNNRSVTFNIDPRTQAMLDQYVKDTSSGGLGSAGDEKMLNIENSFKERIGWKEIEEKGYSTNLLNTTPEQLDTWFDGFINDVLNSGVSDSKKRSTIANCTNIYMQTKMMLKISDIAKNAGANVSNVLLELKHNIEDTRQKNDINFDWSNYTPTINGVSYNLGFGTITTQLQTKYGSLGLLPDLGTNSDEAAIYWQNFQKILDKAAQNAQQNQTSNFLNTHNGAYSASSNHITDYMGYNLITKNQEGVYTYNSATINSVTKELKTLKEEASKAGFKKAIDANQMDRWIKNIETNIKDPLAKHKAFSGLLLALDKAGCIGDVYSYAFSKEIENQDINKKDNNEDSSAGEFLAIRALSKVPSVNKAIEDLITQGRYAESYKIARIDKDNYLYETKMKVFNELFIPPEQQGMYNTLANMIGATAVKSDGTINSSIFKANFKAALQQLYVSLPNNFGKPNGIGKKALLKDATYLEPFKMTNGEIDTNKLNVMCIESIDLINKAKQGMPLLKDAYKQIDFYPDLEQGEIYLRFNGKYEKDNRGNIIGRLIYDKDLKKVSAKNIGQITALNAITNTLYKRGSTDYKRIKEEAIRANKVKLSQMEGLSEADKKRVKDNLERRANYFKTENDYIKTLASYRNVLNDPVKCKKILLQSQQARLKGLEQTIHYESPYYFYNFDNYIIDNLRADLNFNVKNK